MGLSLPYQTLEVACIFTFLRSVQLQENMHSNFDKTTSNFVGDLISSEFSHCGLLFVRQLYPEDIYEFGSQILTDLITEAKDPPVYINIGHAYPSSKDFVQIKKKLPSLNMTLIRMENSVPIRFPITVANYNRRADRCKVIIFIVKDASSAFLQQIHRSISPAYLATAQKDYDHWIWITDLAKLDDLLLSPAFPAKNKYKIGIAQSKDTEKLVVRSVDFFRDDGNPVVIEYSGVFDKNFNYFPDFTLNLKGKTLRVAVPAIPSRIEADPPYEGINNAKRGMWKTLFEEYLMVKFNFTYNVFLARGRGTGLELPNGTWVGTVGEIVAGNAQIAIITAQTPKRIKVVSFTNSFFDISYLNFITTYGARVYSPLALLWPFDGLMWFCIFLSTVVAFLIFKIITRVMAVLGLDKGDAMTFARRGIVSNENWGFSHQLFFVMTSYLDQDCVLPRFTPLRCFVALWLFFSLILTTIFRSKMVSLLAFPVLEQLPETFERLVNSEYKVGFVKHGDSAYNTLKASTDPVYVTLVNEMEIITGVGLECLERVVTTKKYACIAYAFSTIHLKNRNLSDTDERRLVFAPETTYNIFMGMAVEPGSIYKQGLETWLGWTRPFHLADIWEERDMYYNVRLPKRAWWIETNQTQKLAYEPEPSDDLTLKHISGAFFALAGCLLICSIAFAQELLFYNKEKLKRRIFIWKSLKLKLKVIGGFNPTKPVEDYQYGKFDT